MSTKKILLIAIISLLVLILIVGSVIGVMLIRKNTPAKDTIREVHYYNIGDLYSNLKDSKRIVKLKMTLELADKSLIEEMDQKSFLVKHEINEIIRNITEKEIEGKEGQKNLQKLITDQLGKVFETQNIINVYFEELIVQ